MLALLDISEPSISERSGELKELKLAIAKSQRSPVRLLRPKVSFGGFSHSSVSFLSRE